MTEQSDPTERSAGAGLKMAGWVYGVLCLGYLLHQLLPWVPGGLAFIPKTLPIVLLLGLAARLLQGRARRLMLVALGFSACGDVLLALDSFVPGLSAFLLAQLTYSWLMWPDCRFQRQRLVAYLLAGLSIVLLALLLLPRLGALALPVLAYMLAISLMLFLALSHQSVSAGQNPWLALGAAVFVLSDSLIALDRFVTELPHAGLAIMLTYYLAQWWILRGVQLFFD